MLWSWAQKTRRYSGRLLITIGLMWGLSVSNLFLSFWGEESSKECSLAGTECLKKKKKKARVQQRLSALEWCFFGETRRGCPPWGCGQQGTPQELGQTSRQQSPQRNQSGRWRAAITSHQATVSPKFVPRRDCKAGSDFRDPGPSPGADANCMRQLCISASTARNSPQNVHQKTETKDMYVYIYIYVYHTLHTLEIWNGASHCRQPPQQQKACSILFTTMFGTVFKAPFGLKIQQHWM